MKTKLLIGILLVSVFLIGGCCSSIGICTETPSNNWCVDKETLKEVVIPDSFILTCQVNFVIIPTLNGKMVLV